MSKQLGLALGLLAALTVMVTALLLEAGGLPGFGFASMADQNGFTAAPLLLVDFLFILTIIFYVAALAVPHVRLVLLQAIAITIYGLVMAVGGILVAMLALAKLAGLLMLLFAFPFGTIAYFLKFHCSNSALGGDLQPLPQMLGERCFDGTMAVILIALVLKTAALVILFVTSFKFLKVRGLLILAALSGGLSLGLAAVFWKMASLPFLLYPADALLTAVIGLIALIYGLITFVKSLFGLAMAIAGQAG